MAIKTLTAADAVIMISAPDVFPSEPMQLQGFSTDDIYSGEVLEIGETMMGVDGILSAGYTPKPYPQRFMLQADSASIDFFDTLYGQQVTNKTVYALSASTFLPGLQKRFVMSRGFLTHYTPLPEAKKLLQPQTFTITWENVLPSPTA